MRLCMGCMNQIDENLYKCPHCGFDETNVRQEAYYLNPGTIVGGKFIVGKVLSYGGYTVSYIGMDAEYERKVVIKEYLPSDFSTRSEGEKKITIYSGDALEQFEQGLTNFLNEANRIQTLENPEGIARVFDCIAENDTGYVITEYLEGQTLKEILDSGKKYDVEEAKQFIIQILHGLCKVHPLNIIHCDISPETILVTSSGEIKLLDFGATRYVTTANSKSLAIILKQGYAPEEQYRSRGVRGTWTDVYALGAVMYRMVTGIVPQEAVERALTDELKAPSKLGISIPENIENAMLNALNVFQEERTQSAEAFLKELNAADTKRIKVKKRKNDMGKFPVWAKVLVAGLCCAVIVGGVMLVRSVTNDTSNIVKEETLTLVDYSGKTPEEVGESLKAAGFEEIVVNVVEEYNSDADLNGTVFKQKPEAGNGLPEGWQLTDGKVSGVLECYIYTNEKISYREIRDLSAYSLAKKLNWDIQGDKFTGGDGDGEYFEVLCIELNDGSKITKDMLQGEQVISVNDIAKISYCANDFFYWSVLDDYAGKIVSDINEPLYKKVNENSAPILTGEMMNLAEAKSLIDESYYSFVNPAGYIFEQTVEAGKNVDISAGIDGALFLVVGEKLSYGGKTGNALKKELEDLGFTDCVDFTGSCDGTQQILGVTVINQETKEEITEFATGQEVRFKIRTKEKPVVKKKAKKETKKEETPTIKVEEQKNDSEDNETGWVD